MYSLAPPCFTSFVYDRFIYYNTPLVEDLEWFGQTTRAGDYDVGEELSASCWGRRKKYEGPISFTSPHPPEDFLWAPPVHTYRCDKLQPPDKRFRLVDVGRSGRKYNYWQNDVQETNVGGQRKIGIPNKRLNKVREDNGGNMWQQLEEDRLPLLALHYHKRERLDLGKLTASSRWKGKRSYWK